VFIKGGSTVDNFTIIFILILFYLVSALNNAFNSVQK